LGTFSACQDFAKRIAQKLQPRTIIERS